MIRFGQAKEREFGYPLLSLIRILMIYWMAGSLTALYGYSCLVEVVKSAELKEILSDSI